MRGSVPEAPTGRTPYTYNRISANTFELCGEFAYESVSGEYGYPYYDSTSLVKNPDDWSHEPGEWCFTRVVNPVNTIAPTGV